jgi:hypothetical protein
MLELIEDYNNSQTFTSDYYDFTDVNQMIQSASLYKTTAGSELGLIIKK